MLKEYPLYLAVENNDKKETPKFLLKGYMIH